MSAAELRAALRCERSLCACHRGRNTHCPTPDHRDTRPSFGVDERGGRILFYCRGGCSQAAVLAALRARGLWSAAPPERINPRETALEGALRAILRQALAEAWNRPGVVQMYQRADDARGRRRHADRLRRLA